MFGLIEVGMRLTYEMESLGQIRTALGHTIDFRPVFSSRGYSTHKEFIASLRLIRTFKGQASQVSVCKSCVNSRAICTSPDSDTDPIDA